MEFDYKKARNFLKKRHLEKKKNNEIHKDINLLDAEIEKGLNDNIKHNKGEK